MIIRGRTFTWTAPLLTAAMLAPGTTALAQEPAVVAAPLTLEQVLALAESRSESIASARAGIRRAEGDALRARSGRLPQLSASASYDRALASEFEGIFDGAGGAPCDPFAPNPAAPVEARVAEIERAIDCGAVGSPVFGGGAQGDDEEGADLPFGRENTWRVNLAFSQLLYAGGRVAAQEAIALAGRENAELSLTSARAQLLFDVTQAYYDAALSDRLVEIAEATFAQADATFRQVQASFNAGTQPEFELLRARVTRDTQRPIIIRQQANREIAMLRLKQLLELPPAAPLQLAAGLDEPTLGTPAPFAARLVAVDEALQSAASSHLTPLEGAPASERVAVREVSTVVHLREAALRAARAERLPSVSVTSSYGRVAYPSGFFPGAEFRTNWTVGATVQVPILTGGRLRGDAAVAAAELEQSRLQLAQVEELAVLDTQSAWAELVAARAAWLASAGTIEQAGRAHQIADVRYRAGISTQLELSDARLLLQQSEANRAQAARDLQVARARVALLPDLPLSTGTPAGTTPQPQQPFVLPATPAPQQPLGGGQLRTASLQQAASPTGARQ